MILHIVSERYPRDEDTYVSDTNSAANSASTIDDDEVLSHDEDMEVSAPEFQPSSLCNHICFGSFGNSDLSTVHSVLIPSIQPKIDGFTIKIGEITCPLIDSSCNINSVSAVSNENEKSKNLDSKIVVSEAIK
jgi:hypothetical protein